MTPLSPQTPAPWVALMQALHVAPSDGSAWWQALSRSRWSRPAQLRQTFIGQIVRDGPLTPERAQHFLQTMGTPATLMAILDDLAKEAVLAEACARRVEEALLRQLDSQGHWKEEDI